MVRTSITARQLRVGRLVKLTRLAALRWLPAILVLVAVVLGGLHTWVAARSYSMNEDGIAYLDIGDAFWRGDWSTAISPVWSPLYAWLLGLVMRIVQPPLRWEFPLVHLVNFGVYLAALASFRVFWRSAGRYRATMALSLAGGDNVHPLPDWAWSSIGYALFIWTALGLIEVWAVTPDMLMSALVYLAGAVLIRIRLGQADWLSYVQLGLLLGLGYLSKAIMFPLAIAFLGLGWLSASDLRRALPRFAAATAVFALIAGAYVGAVYSTTGRLTFGDAGRLTYVRYVNGLPYPHWQGGDPALGVPEHPSRQILQQPPVFEFAAPIGGTYPIGHDPSYWYAGATPRFDLRGQAQTLIASAFFYLDLFFRQQAGLVLAALVWYAIDGRRRLAARSLPVHWGLALSALVAFGLYAVVYVEGRYVAVFVTLFWADILANARWQTQPVLRRMSAWLGAGALALLLVNILIFNLAGLGTLSAPARPASPAIAAARPPSWPGEVAEELLAVGVAPGDKVGVIGYAFSSFWARLARVQIVAEMLDTDAGQFWAGDAAVQAQVVEAFASTSAKAIVAENVPSYATLPGWQPLGQTNYAIFFLKP